MLAGEASHLQSQLSVQLPELPIHMTRVNQTIAFHFEEERRRDLNRTLTVKKRLRDHLVIKDFYD